MNMDINEIIKSIKELEKQNKEYQETIKQLNDVNKELEDRLKKTLKAIMANVKEGLNYKENKNEEN